MPLKMYSGAKGGQAALKSRETAVFKPPSSKHIIGVAAGKGGVGKSTVTVNLALALSQKGFKVGILDADVYGPSVRMMLGKEGFPRMQGSTIYPAQSQNVKLISMAYFRKEGEAYAVRAPMANGLIQQFIAGVEWGELDFLFIDFPPGTGDVQLTLSQKAHLSSALVVTTPQEVALLDVRKAIHLFDQLKIPILGVVENMSYYERNGEKIHLFGKGGGEKLSKEIGAPFLGSIPIDPIVSSAGDRGKNIFSTDEPDSQKARETFSALANEVLSHSESLNKETEGSLSNFQLIWREI